MEQGFPRLIGDDFPGVEPKVDAALHAFGKMTLISLPMRTLWGIFYQNNVENQSYFQIFGLMSFLLQIPKKINFLIYPNWFKFCFSCIISKSLFHTCTKKKKKKSEVLLHPLSFRSLCWHKNTTMCEPGLLMAGCRFPLSHPIVPSLLPHSKGTCLAFCCSL